MIISYIHHNYYDEYIYNDYECNAYVMIIYIYNDYECSTGCFTLIQDIHTRARARARAREGQVGNAYFCFGNLSFRCLFVKVIIIWYKYNRNNRT